MSHCPKPIAYLLAISFLLILVGAAAQGVGLLRAGFGAALIMVGGGTVIAEESGSYLKQGEDLARRGN